MENPEKPVIKKGKDLLKISINSSSVIGIKEVEKLKKLLDNYDVRHMNDVIKARNKALINNTELGNYARVYGYKIDRK